MAEMIITWNLVDDSFISQMEPSAKMLIVTCTITPVQFRGMTKTGGTDWRCGKAGVDAVFKVDAHTAEILIAGRAPTHVEVLGSRHPGVPEEAEEASHTVGYGPTDTFCPVCGSPQFIPLIASKPGAITCEHDHTNGKVRDAR